ncbi:MAG: DUF2093 domain-containing protein [Pseudomonadota bacterium]
MDFKFDAEGPMDGEAVLSYGDAEYKIVKPGAYVTCAVTGARIALDALRYWNVERQEAYADAAASLQAHRAAAGGGRG